VIFWQKNIGAKAACKMLMKIDDSFIVVVKISAKELHC